MKSSSPVLDVFSQCTPIASDQCLCKPAVTKDAVACILLLSVVRVSLVLLGHLEHNVGIAVGVYEATSQALCTEEKAHRILSLYHSSVLIELKLNTKQTSLTASKQLLSKELLCTASGIAFQVTWRGHPQGDSSHWKLLHAESKYREGSGLPLLDLCPVVNLVRGKYLLKISSYIKCMCQISTAFIRSE